MQLELYKRAAITTDLPQYGLRMGDVVMLVDDLTARDGSPGYAVEVFNAVGDTIDVHFIAATAVEPLREDEVLCVRPREKVAAWLSATQRRLSGPALIRQSRPFACKPEHLGAERRGEKEPALHL